MGSTEQVEPYSAPEVASKMDVVAAKSENPEKPSASERNTPEDRATELWDLALSRLHERSPGVILTYTSVVSRWLESKGYDVPRRRRRSVIEPSDRDIDPDKSFVKILLDQVGTILRKGSKPDKSDGEDKINGEDEANGEDGTDSCTKSTQHSIVEDAVLLNKALRVGLQAYPYASIAWAALTITIEVSS